MHRSVGLGSLPNGPDAENALYGPPITPSIISCWIRTTCLYVGCSGGNHGFRAGLGATVFEKFYYEFVFSPTLFDVTADVIQTLMIVTPSKASVVYEIDPSGNVRNSDSNPGSSPDSTLLFSLIFSHMHSWRIP